ncbi:MAG: methyltransferase domain-containing protein [Candidatus Riflebacteria bacterium]|nr:methyltransferase domain-containing protein [Candidatus Riflebacteria bacterium]
MHIKHISWLKCVDCGGKISFKAGQKSAERLENGVLGCQDCNRLYPVLDGIVVMFTRSAGHSLSPKERDYIKQFNYPLSEFGCDNKTANDLDLKQIAVQENWEYQWEQICPFTESDLKGQGLLGSDAFKNFIPVEPSQINGATILVGGAGRGREAYHLAGMGAKTIVAVELGREIHAIKNLLPQNSQTELLLLRADLVALPLQADLVDIAICDHALQHVHDHKKGFSEMTRVTRDSGKVAICVYSWEGNFIMTHMVEPLKFFLHKIPLTVLYFLSLIPSLVLQFIIMFFYVPIARVSPRLLKKIPLHEHMIFWSQNKFKTTWMSIFDLFHAPISYHFRREEVSRLAESNGMSIECIRHTNSVLWSLIAVKNRPEDSIKTGTS